MEMELEPLTRIRKQELLKLWIELTSKKRNQCSSKSYYPLVAPSIKGALAPSSRVGEIRDEARS